jgi:acyl-coenzyme A synthetase/AMP-(fatty) acid ligase
VGNRQAGVGGAARRTRLKHCPHEAVDRHANGALRNHLALRWISREGQIEDFTYGDLKEKSNRFANLLRQLGIGKGDAVFALAGRIPELYIAALGALKNGSVFCPLFSAFGPEPLRQRLSKGEAKVLVTTTTRPARSKTREECWKAAAVAVVVRCTCSMQRLASTVVMPLSVAACQSR